MNMLLERSANDISITRRQLITQTLSKTVKDTADHTKPDEFLFGRDFEEKFKAAKSLEKASKDMRAANFSGKTFTVQKRGEEQQRAPSASLVSRPESHFNRKRPVHQRREMKPFRGQQRSSKNAPTKKYTQRSRDR
nr:unnamed protein product [Callosobruchus analis]